MDFNLVHFDYSPWLIIACIALGILYAYFHYYRSRLSEIADRWKVISLAVIRGIIVSVLAFLILGPIIQYFDSHVEEPRLVVAVDNTLSMVAPIVSDSAEVRKSINETLAELNKHFEVDTLIFSDRIEENGKITFAGKATNIDEVMTYVKSRYEGIPLAGLILLSDGIYNQGKSPAYSITGMKTPIYTIPYGDSTKKSDLKVAQVLHNRIAYLGDEFPLEVDVIGEKMDAQNHSVNLYNIDGNGESQLLKTEQMRIREGSSFNSVSFRVKASRVGVQHLRVSVPPIAGELTTANNYKDIFIDVIDSRQKIAIVASSAHPDIGAIESGLSAFDNYDVEKYVLPDSPDNLNDYDLVVLHQIPGGGKSSNRLLSAVENAKIPVIWLVGAQSDIVQLNRLQSIIAIRQNTRQNDEVQASVNSHFSFFDLDDRIKEQIVLYPPLDVPFGDFKAETGAQILLNQVVGKIKTEKPLIAINDRNNLKSALIAGEGIWRWKLYDYLENENNENFNNLLSQIVKFLSARKDLRKFIVESEKKVYEENDKVRFTANIYNDAYQAQTDPSISIVISEEGRQYDYAFTPLSSNYSLDAGHFSPGTYNWTAETTFDGNQLRASGQFIVSEIQKEYLDLEADFALLRHLSEETGGEMWTADKDISAEIRALKDSPYAKKVKYTTEKNKPLIAMQWIGGLLALLLLSEWFLRRLMGDY